MVPGALCESAAAEDDYGETVLAVAHYSEPLRGTAAR
jgi:hypothetical protein